MDSYILGLPGLTKRRFLHWRVAVIAACSNKCGSMQYEVTPCGGSVERKCDGERTSSYTLTSYRHVIWRLRDASAFLREKYTWSKNMKNCIAREKNSFIILFSLTDVKYRLSSCCWQYSHIHTYSSKHRIILSVVGHNKRIAQLWLTNNTQWNTDFLPSHKKTLNKSRLVYAFLSIDACKIPQFRYT